MSACSPLPHAVSHRSKRPARLSRGTPRSAPAFHRRAIHGQEALLLLLVALILLLTSVIPGARAQENASPSGSLLANDDGVVTGFSGTVERAGKAFIDTKGASVRIFALGRSGPLDGNLHQPPVKREIPASQVGQVFGIAIDRMFPPNIYVTATSAYGLHIVVPDESGDGVPETLLKGRAGAQWMDGQWGPGGGPGGIWKIDGATGTVSLLANLPTGPAGLGQIAFDPVHYQLFVSDLDTGLIHRLDLNGNVIDTFDHGQAGRPAAGLEAVADDGFSADITSADFDIENPNTWGFTSVRRRVWGLAVHDGRLYYAVAAGPQIFSVSIDPDTGALGTDVRLEIEQVPGGMQVSDILFDGKGRMYLAQRGTPLNALDFTTFHAAGGNKVLRYERDRSGAWVRTPPAGPRQYAIGFPRPHENAAGGIALSCRGLLWSTGDNLRNDPVVLRNGPYAVHGLQGNPLRLVMPRNMPPYVATFVDYDGVVGDPRNVGHVGDVEILRNCGGWPLPPAWTPPAGWTPPSQTPLPVPYKRGLTCVKDEETGDWLCDYEIRVVNWGAEAFSGPLLLWDIPAAGVSFEAVLEGSVGFTCTQPDGPGTRIRCEARGSLSLDLFASAWLRLRMRIPAAVALADADAFRNCVAIGDDGIVRDCSTITPPEPRLLPQKQRVVCDRDDGDYVCRYLLTLTNNGGAPFTGRPEITDEPGPGVELVGDNDGFGPDGVTPLAWTCAQDGGAGAAIRCTADTEVTIQPGESVDVEVVTRIPAGSPPEAFRNCALAAPGGARDCVEEERQTTREKELETCWIASGEEHPYTCIFRLTFTNLGPGNWTGRPQLTDTPGPGVTLEGNSPGWTCNQAGAGQPIECVADGETTLNPGETASLEIQVLIAADAPDEAYVNCLLLDGDGGPRQCVDIPRRDEPRLTPRKRAEGCERVQGGMRCIYTLSMGNITDVAYEGVVILSDIVGPGVTFLSNAHPADWTCNQAAAGIPVVCESTAAQTIPPGGSVTERISVFIPDGSPDASYTDCLVPGEMPHAAGMACQSVAPQRLRWGGDPVMRHGPRCPSGWEDFTGARPPSGWQTMTVGSGDRRRLCARPRPRQEPRHDGQVPDPGTWGPGNRPQCPPGFKPVSPNQLGVLKKRGWNLRRIARGRWCGIPPVTPQCPPGWKPVSPNQLGALKKRGWNLRRIARGLWCGIPPVTPQCPPGFKPVSPNQLGALKKRGWNLRRIGRGLWCGIPPVTPQCPSGWKPVSPNQLGVLKKRGWSLRRIARGLWCGKPSVAPQCPQGTVRHGDVCTPVVTPCPKGTVRRGRRCVPVVRPCPKGMKRVGNRCVRIPPRCKPGYHLVRGRCVPVVRPCPKGMKRVGNRCVRIPPRCKPGYRLVRGKCVPVVRPCPKGMKRVGNRCVRIPPRCKPGYRLVRGKCVKVVRPRACPKGTVRTRQGCVPVRIDPRLLQRRQGTPRLQ